VVLWNVNIIIDNVLESNVGPTGRNGMFKVKNKIIFIFLAFMSIACSAADNTSMISDSNNNGSSPFYRWPQESNFNASAPVENGNNSTSWDNDNPVNVASPPVNNLPNTTFKQMLDALNAPPHSNNFAPINRQHQYNQFEQISPNESDTTTCHAFGELNTTSNNFSSNNTQIRTFLPEHVVASADISKVVKRKSNQRKRNNSVLTNKNEKKINENWSKPMMFLCPTCNKKHKNPAAMYKCLEHHATTIKKDVNGKYTCNICFKKIKNLRKHLRYHINYQSYPCKHIAHDGRTTCLRRFGNPSKRKTHQTNHDQAIHQCPHCDSFFKSKVWAKKHCAKFFQSDLSTGNQINDSKQAKPTTKRRKLNKERDQSAPIPKERYLTEEEKHLSPKFFELLVEERTKNVSISAPTVVDNSVSNNQWTGFSKTNNNSTPVIDLTNTSPYLHSQNGHFDRDHGYQIINTHEKAPTTPIEDWPEPIICPWSDCNEPCTSPKTMWEHLITHETTIEKNEDGKYTCNICPQKIKNLRKHLRYHAHYQCYLCGDPAFNGTKCVRRFFSLVRMKKHKEKHNQAKHKCHYCNSFFVYMNTAKNHCAKFFQSDLSTGNQINDSKKAKRRKIKNVASNSVVISYLNQNSSNNFSSNNPQGKTLLQIPVVTSAVISEVVKRKSNQRKRNNSASTTKRRKIKNSKHKQEKAYPPGFYTHFWEQNQT